jgi:hypothetical protein
MTSGSLVLNGVTDKQLAAIVEFKVSPSGQFNFNLAATQQVPVPPNQPSIYNNFIITWANDAGLKSVVELLSTLLA